MPDTPRPEPFPAYLRIAEMLTRDIATGRLADGQRLAPERHLAPELGVSVGTLRKALAELEARGLLQRRHGSGNYVRHDMRAAAGYGMFRLELPQGGGQPSARLLDVTRTDRPDVFPGPGTHAFRIRRLRLLSGQPVAVEEIWLDGRFAEALDPAALAGALYRYYQTEFRLWILKAEDTIGLGTAPDWAPNDFEVAPGGQTLRINRRAVDQHGVLAEFSINDADPAAARYVSHLP